MELLKRFMNEEEGLGTVEIVLIVVVLVGLVILFQGKMKEILGKIFNTVNTGVDSIQP